MAARAAVFRGAQGVGLLVKTRVRHALEINAQLEAIGSGPIHRVTVKAVGQVDHFTAGNGRYGFSYGQLGCAGHQGKYWQSEKFVHGGSPIAGG